MTNLRASIEETRTNDHELKARVQEATNSLNKKTKDINAMTNKWVGDYMETTQAATQDFCLSWNALGDTVPS